MSDIPIDKSVPMPSPSLGPSRKYPFNQMEVGDSFFVQGGEKVVNTVRASCRNHTVSHPGRRFMTRKVEDGIRVWRVE